MKAGRLGLMWHDRFRSGHAVARLLGRLSLRARLVAVSVCLLAAGAGIIGVASELAVRGHLMRQADEQLRAYADCLTSAPFVATPIYGLAPGTCSANSPGGAVSIEVRNLGGQLVMRAGPGARSPAVPARIAARAGRLATIPAGGGSWRVIAEPIHYRAQRIPFAYSADDFSLVITTRAQPGLAGTLVVALDLRGIGRTVGRLAVSWLVASEVAILAVGGLGAGVIRIILRPLTQMDKIAAVAAGDLSRRVPDHDGRCEVGRLAGSLNRMLSQVEQSFNTRAESEATARRSTDRSCRIVADTACELRRPLGVIHGFAEYYRQRGRPGPGELDRMIRRVADEAAGMDALARDLLPRHDKPR